MCLFMCDFKDTACEYIDTLFEITRHLEPQVLFTEEKIVSLPLPLQGTDKNHCVCNNLLLVSNGNLENEIHLGGVNNSIVMGTIWTQAILRPR